jgi:hypothetical protein
MQRSTIVMPCNTSGPLTALGGRWTHLRAPPPRSVLYGESLTNYTWAAHENDSATRGLVGSLDPAFFSQFGIVDVDWSHMKHQWAAGLGLGPAPAYGPCQ